MSKYLTEENIQQIKTWAGWGKNTDFKLLYRAQDNGFVATSCHDAINNKGATIVLVALVTGEIFGGYTSVNWESTNVDKADASAFLFKLWGTPQIFRVNPAAPNAIRCHAAFGPSFGATDLVIFPTVNTLASSTLNPAVYPQPSGTGAPNTALAGKPSPWTALDVEVLQVLPSPAATVPPPMDDQVQMDWDHVDEMRKLAREWRLACGNMRVGRGTGDEATGNALLVGNLGAGKSTTINTLITALSGGTLVRRIAKSADSTSSVTINLCGYDLQKLARLAYIHLIDTPGWRDGSYSQIVEQLFLGQIPANDSKKIGDLAVGKRLPDHDLVHATQCYETLPHCVVFVFRYDAMSQTSLDHVKAALQQAESLELGRVAILTHCDKDPTVKAKGMKSIYSSPTLRDKRDILAGFLKISRGEVFLLGNYSHESHTSPINDALALFALRGIQQCMDDFFARFQLGLSGFADQRWRQNLERPMNYAPPSSSGSK